MDIKTALENIKVATDVFAKEEFLCIRENREEAIPVLLEYIKTVVDLGEDLPEDYDAHFYAMYLLAEFRVHEAFSVLIEYLKFDSEFVECVLGDILTEDFGAILASVATIDDIPAIKAVVEDKKLDEYQRSAATSALQVLFVEGVFERDKYEEYLRYVLENYRDNATFLGFVIIECKDAGFLELLPVIEKLYEEDLVETAIIHLSDLKKKIFWDDEATAKQKMKKDRSLFISDSIAMLEKWSCFNEKPVIEARTIPDKPDFGRKVGRNEPCPCGSGKKYKKCCGY